MLYFNNECGRYPSKEQFASVEGLSVRQTALKLGVFVCLIRNRISAPAGARSGV